MKFRILKSKGLYYIQYEHTEWPDLMFIPIYLILYPFSKKVRDYLRNGNKFWYKYDNMRSHQSLQSAKDRLKELLEPDEVIDIN